MKKKTKTGKGLLKVLAILIAVVVVFTGVATALTSVGNKANAEKISSFSAVENDSQLIPEKDENGRWTFTTDRDFKILHLTDVHIGAGFMCQKKDAMALNAVASMVTAEKPDLVVITGDIAYPVPFQAGTINNLNAAKLFASLMEKLGVYWTMTYGNHDTESYSKYTREDLDKFYSSDELKYCLYEPDSEEVDGYGNNVINIKNSKGIITQSIFTFDSHSYVDGDVLGLMWKYDNIHENQVDWYKKTVISLNEENQKTIDNLELKEKSDIKSLAFFHIPLVEQKDAWYEFADNGFKDTENVKLHYGVAGEGNKVVYSGIGEDELFETMLELGSTKGVFCGHDHYNNFSIDYKGIRLTYGMSVDYLAYPGIYKEGSQRGCTVITIESDGSFDCKSESYYQDKYTSVFGKDNIEEVVMQELTQIAPVKS